MLTQNSEMRKLGIHNWTLPAWVVRTSDGKAVNVCPQAGACVKLCYARNGTYNFKTVKAAHVRNLEMVLNDLNGWMVKMMDELQKRRFRPKNTPTLPDLSRDHLSKEVAALLDTGAACIRIHDSGDFLNEEYLLAWLAIASHTPDTLFYSYTKEVSLFKKVLAKSPPANFLWCYSMGGKQDHLIDKKVDYHADVFPDEDAIKAAGYFNNIPHFKKQMAGRTFAEIEATMRRKPGTPKSKAA